MSGSDDISVPSATAAPNGGITRRTALFGASAVAWSNLTLISKARAAQTLHVLAWPGYDETPVVAAFEDANNVMVQF